MPRTRFENFIFTVIMAFIMVYAMICYNISLAIGGMTDRVFLMAFGELRIMWPVAIVLEMFVMERAVIHLTNRVVTRDMPLIWMLLIRCSLTVCLMCPAMSLIASVLYYPYYLGFHPITLVANWLKLMCFNFPFAWFTQVFMIQPLVRTLFRTLMGRRMVEAPAQQG